MLTAEHRLDPSAVPAHSPGVEQRLSVIEGHLSSLQRALKAHQARLDSLTRDVGELSERSERERELARDLGLRAREIGLRRGEESKGKNPDRMAGQGEERRWGDDNYAWTPTTPSPPYELRELRIGDIVRGPVHARSASEAATHSRSASEGYDPTAASDPGHTHAGVCTTDVSRSGSAANNYAMTHSRNNSQNSHYGSYGFGTGLRPCGEGQRTTTPGFDDMEVLASSDPFAAPLPGKPRKPGRRAGVVTPSAPRPGPGDVLTPPPSQHTPSPHPRPRPHSSAPYATPSQYHTPTHNDRGDADSTPSSLHRRQLQQLEQRLSSLEAHIGLVPGQQAREPSMDQRLVRLEMSVGQMIEGTAGQAADSMYDPIYDSVYHD